MRLVLQIIAIAVFGYMLELVLPWYSIAFVAFIFGYLLDSESNFMGGFLGIAFAWGIRILLVTNDAGQDLATKVAQIMEPIGEKWLLILVTLIIGGLVGGLAAVTGASLRVREEYN